MATLMARLSSGARLPASRRLTEVNDRLRREAEAHEATLRDLEGARQELETRVVERTAELGLVTARFETALHGSNVTVYTQDRDLRYAWISGPIFGHAIDQIIGRDDEELLPADGRGPIIALKRQALETGKPQDGEFRVQDRGNVLWYDMHIEPLRDVGGTIVGLTCATVDITNSKNGEAHLRELLRELTHRSKNLLAVIQGMARQTARHAGTIDAFLDQFGARLQALAASHDLLVQESWHGASLSELVRSQLGHYLDRGPQVVVEGPAVLLKPEAAQSLALALHELATNASKYGALSVAGGQVAIRWRELPPGEGGGIEVLWTESGGPEIAAAPERRGFGTLVIERNLARTLEAEVKLDFASPGLRCRIVIPATHLAVGR